MQSELTRLEMNCPMNGKACVDGVRSDFEANEHGVKNKCRWWTHVTGKDPQSEKVIDHFDCAMAWMPVTTLEASQMTRQNTATMQEFRNETKTGLQNFNKAVSQAALAFNAMAESQRALIEGVELPDQLEHKNGDGTGDPDAN